MSDKTLRLRIEGGIWVADHLEDDEPDPFIVDLFGTHTLPLPYTEIVDSSYVFAEQTAMQAVRQPHVRVVLVTQ